MLLCDNITETSFSLVYVDNHMMLNVNGPYWRGASAIYYSENTIVLAEGYLLEALVLAGITRCLDVVFVGICCSFMANRTTS